MEYLDPALGWRTVTASVLTVGDSDEVGLGVDADGDDTFVATVRMSRTEAVSLGELLVEAGE
jgi:hypothetical protein